MSVLGVSRGAGGCNGEERAGELQQTTNYSFISKQLFMNCHLTSFSGKNE
jgi:hypothetical protein